MQRLLHNFPICCGEKNWPVRIAGQRIKDANHPTFNLTFDNFIGVYHLDAESW